MERLYITDGFAGINKLRKTPFGKNQRMFYLVVRLSKDVSVFYLKIQKSKEPLEAEQNWIKASSKKKIKKSFLVVVEKKFLLSI